MIKNNVQFTSVLRRYEQEKAAALDLDFVQKPLKKSNSVFARYSICFF